MASVSDVEIETPEQALAKARRRCEELHGMIHAIVRKAGGEVELSVSDFQPSFAAELRRTDVGGKILLSVVDPNAPVEGGHYWVRTAEHAVGAAAAWAAAKRWDGCWWITGHSTPVEPMEIGPRIKAPTADTPATIFHHPV